MYRHLFLRASKKGKFTSDDVVKNDIEYEDENNPEGPKFVKDFRVESENWITMSVVFVSYAVFGFRQTRLDDRSKTTCP